MIEGFEQVELIARGGFAKVYRAHQPRFNRDVALKVLDDPLDDTTRARFERECRTLGALSTHPNIVTVFDSGVTTDGHGYLVLELCPGGSLADRIANGPLPWQDVTTTGVKLAGALATAHDRGVLHRDIKPENVLITAFGEPALADFGIARVAGGWRTSSGLITASVLHAAPEVLAGDPGTESSDQWSLASTLWQLLDGRAPFAEPTDQTLTPLVGRILSQPPRPIGRTDIPPSLVAALSRALAKDPGHRYPSMRSFVDALHIPGTTATPLPPIPLAEGAAVPESAIVAEPTADEPAPTRVVARRQTDTRALAAPTDPPSQRRARRLLAATVIAVVIALVGVLAVLAVRPASPSPDTPSPGPPTAPPVSTARYDSGTPPPARPSATPSPDTPSG